MRVPLGLPGCEELAVEVGGAGVFVLVCVACCVGWTLLTALLVGLGMCGNAILHRDRRSAGGGGGVYGGAGVWGGKKEK